LFLINHPLSLIFMLKTLFSKFILYFHCLSSLDYTNLLTLPQYSGISNNNYVQVIHFYTQLAENYSSINLRTVGITDSGHPLHLVTFSPSEIFNFKELQKENAILLINNGIHPGEPDGIEAT